VPTRNFHAQVFDEGTLTKLDVFQLYTREWLPVFMSPLDPFWKQIHIFDFFCGPGGDTSGAEGSPVRIVQEILSYRSQRTSNTVPIHLHFSDADTAKILSLKNKLAPMLAGVPDITATIETLEFAQAFQKSLPILNDRAAAKLVFLDPCGVNFVDHDIFRQLINSKTTDFLFFLATSYLNRFRELPSIKLKIKRPDDFHHVHRVALEEFKGLIPAGKTYYLAPFSIKKKKNIYGIIFGSANPLGMDKFLTTAWNKAPFNGEANFDIDREDFRSEEPFLPTLFTPTKQSAFEAALKDAILSGTCLDETAIVALCYEHGMKRQHAEAVLQALKKEQLIDCDFRVPQLKGSRLITLSQKP
jgi:three-Cys-motif partner protein